MLSFFRFLRVYPGFALQQGLFFLLCCLVVQGCSSIPQPRQHSPLTLSRQALAEQFACLVPLATNLVGSGSVTVERTFSKTVESNFAFAEPRQIRIEILNLFSQPAFLFVSDGKLVTAGQTSSSAQRLPADQFTGKSLGLGQITLDDLVALLLVAPPDWSHVQTLPWRAEQQAGKIVFFLEDAQKQQLEIAISAAGGELLSYKRSDALGQVTLSVFWESYQVTHISSPGKLLFPRLITVSWPPQKTRLLVQYEQGKADTIIPPAMFSPF